MQAFHSLAEIKQAELTPEIRRAVTRVMRNLLNAYGEDYDPDDCGYVVLIDHTTTNTHAVELMGRQWHEARLEGVTFSQDTGCFATCVLCNNQFGFSIIVPDEPWLDPRFREALMADLLGKERP